MAAWVAGGPAHAGGNLDYHYNFSRGRCVCLPDRRSIERSASMQSVLSRDWVKIRRDAETGIECVHAHFRGHAYDPHDHDEMLVGVTYQGVQRFRCHRALHTSTPGRAILIEPGAVHDGHAQDDTGFTYGMLYLPQPWVGDMMRARGHNDASVLRPSFHHTLNDNVQLRDAIHRAFVAILHAEGRLARDQRLDALLDRLAAHLQHRPASQRHDAPTQLDRARDYLHEQRARDIGLAELAGHAGIDRFRLTRQFSRAFGMSPHAYLVRLRLREARRLLASGCTPAQAAMDVGFADQSHLGRWFQRAYRMTPAAYRRQCTNVLD
jgi:AraC-like DNA-binding protein